MHSHEQLLSDFISSTGTQDRIDAAINECFTHTNILDKIKTIGLDRDTEISLIDEKYFPSMSDRTEPIHMWLCRSFATHGTQNQSGQAAENYSQRRLMGNIIELCQQKIKPRSNIRACV